MGGPDGLGPPTGPKTGPGGRAGIMAGPGGRIMGGPDGRLVGGGPGGRIMGGGPGGLGWPDALSLFQAKKAPAATRVASGVRILMALPHDSHGSR
jgi:hypothetical protein